MDYKIEKGIPLPKRTRTAKYPFADMQVGDSFVVEVAFEELMPKVMRRMVAAKTTAASLLRKQRNDHTAFVVGEVPEGVRVWRKE